MIDEPELKLAQITIIQLYFSQLYEVTRNLGNHNRTTAYEWSEINGYLYKYTNCIYGASAKLFLRPKGIIILKEHSILTNAK